MSKLFTYKYIPNKNAQIQKSNNSLIIISQNNDKSCGFYTTLFTKQTLYYRIIINAQMISNTEAFLYCESSNNTRILERNIFITKTKNDIHAIFKGINDITKIGLLFSNGGFNNLKLNDFLIQELPYNFDRVFIKNDIIINNYDEIPFITFENYFNLNDILKLDLKNFIIIQNKPSNLEDSIKKAIKNKNMISNNDILYFEQSQYNEDITGDIITVIPMYKRHDVLNKAIESIKEQTIKSKIVLFPSFINDLNYAIKSGLYFCFCPNNPLSYKYNYTSNYCKIYNPEAYLFMGSDDILTKYWIESCLKYIQNYDVIGKTYHYIYNLEDEKKYKNEYKDDREGIDERLKGKYFIGTGRMISGDFLRKIDYNVFDFNDIKYLDYKSQIKLLDKGARFYNIDKEHGDIICIKGKWECITDIKKYFESKNVIFSEIFEIPFFKL
jgi:hypothetical protein